MKLTIEDTLFLKGVAVLLLLWHHLFYIDTGLYNDIVVAGHGLVNITGQMSKVCVAVFVLLSGYGLTVQNWNCPINVMIFFKKRFVKLFTGYWIIWVLFVPIGFFFYNWSLESVYGNHGLVKFFIQVFGIQDLFGFHGLNATWWFMSCIIVLYLIFPILNKLNRGWLIVATIFSVISIVIPVPHLRSIQYYLICFIAGIWMARYRKITPPHLLNSLTFWVCAVVIIALWREKGIMFRGMSVDGILAVAIVMLYKSLPVVAGWIIVLFTFIGKHSMNIFLFHSFIYYYYWPEVVFWSRNPLIIYVTLLITCLFISYVIEILKNRVTHSSGYNWLTLG